MREHFSDRETHHKWWATRPMKQMSAHYLIINWIDRHRRTFFCGKTGSRLRYRASAFLLLALLIFSQCERPDKDILFLRDGKLVKKWEFTTADGAQTVRLRAWNDYWITEKDSLEVYIDMTIEHGGQGSELAAFPESLMVLYHGASLKQISGGYADSKSAPNKGRFDYYWRFGGKSLVCEIPPDSLALNEIPLFEFIVKPFLPQYIQQGMADRIVGYEQKTDLLRLGHKKLCSEGGHDLHPGSVIRQDLPSPR